MRAIEDKRCTPFLGAAACTPPLPMGRELAMICANEFEYPFQDSHDLARVTQYAAELTSAEDVKAFVAKVLRGRGPRRTDDSAEPHQVLAELDLPIYITTNYDDFMIAALKERGREPEQKVCQWYLERPQRRNLIDEEWPEPDQDHPIVYHLHGVWAKDKVNSMVLTEEDYLDFLIWAGAPDAIPSRIERSFSEESLLFMGYSLRDVTFKVLFRKLSGYMRMRRGKKHAAVQIDPTTVAETESERRIAEKEREYLKQQLGNSGIRVYWGKCADFAADLQKHWEDYRNVHPPGSSYQQTSVRWPSAVHS